MPAHRFAFRLFPRFVVLCAGLALVACGGGGGSDAPSETTIMLLTADGFDGDYTTVGTPLAIDHATLNSDSMRAGRRTNTDVLRAYLSFEHPAELTGKEIVSAQLRVFQLPPEGTPFANNGSVLLFSVDVGETLMRPVPNTVLLPLPVLSTDATIGWKQSDVAAAVRADLTAGRVRSQFRLQSTAELDSTPAGQAFFATAEASADMAQAPQLVITYR